MKIRPHTAGVDLVDNLITLLLTINKIEWARIYCELNCWKFPKELEELKPKWWVNDNADGPGTDVKSDIISPINNKIIEVLGRRWISREWNKGRMTEHEHNVWWIKNKIEHRPHKDPIKPKVIN